MPVSSLAALKLACQRGGRIVVPALSFKVEAGRALILRGPNGAGKTTLLRTIAGYLPADSGRVIVSDDKGEGTGEGHFHYIGHTNGIKPRLSVIENVSFWQRFYSGADDADAAENALDAFALLDLAEYRAGHLSQGQARRLGLARLLASKRSVWLLDEPSVSLDAASTRRLETAIRHHLAQGGIALVSTHLDLALGDAATVLELQHGRAFAA
ncbi:heme ABC exporter ATP-binding protein CcmA [Rhodomicrobium sp. Az07]|uniref:heme ABC exporter ATP-binding protein CcmA n=1 Tax=Rhodomicrobium sp. Az07 TaxID=2839034 RepID=UPI001BE9B19C|nr:heme ABC exporter ATP-binding protein CcmA [Rhodomicrobium sp. Az07]MBT3069737.1 heme ABC exporter ATP-binding protein CcmA [Rhodomicrobium sp. Az07]